MSTPTLDELRDRIDRLHAAPPRVALPVLEPLAGLLTLQAGGVYAVEQASLVLALLAGPSRAGAFCAVVGIDDLGYEAAARWGVDLDRIVVVPDPGPDWLEATAALADVASLVVVRPPGRVAEGTAMRLSARLRERSSVLIAWGAWPRCTARLRLEDSAWEGPGTGEGHLRSRRAVLAVRRGSAPPRRRPLLFTEAGIGVPATEPLRLVG